MKKIAIFSLIVGTLLLAANVSFARDGSKDSKTETIQKVYAPEQPAILITDLAMYSVPFVVADEAPIEFADYNVSRLTDATGSEYDYRLSPAEVPRLCDRHWLPTDQLANTKDYAPPKFDKIKEPRRSNIKTEGYQVKKE